MELKHGYRQTEVGVLPEDWEISPLDVLGSVIDGDRGVNYPNGKDFNADGYCLFLNAGNVTKSGFKFSNCAFITREKDEKLSKGKLKCADIVLTTRGTVGNFAYFDHQVPFEHMRINSGMVILRNKSAALDTTFFYTFLLSHFTQLQIERLSFGSAQPQLTVRGISKLWIAVPPSREEQCAIATALSDVDALLDGLDRLVAKKRDFKQAAMQQLLTGETRLPGFEGEWEVKRLGDAIEKLVGGGTPSRGNPAFWGNEIPWVTVKDFATFHPRQTQESITKVGLNNSASHLIPAGTLITSTRMALGKVVVYEVDVAINQDLKALFLKQTASVQFLYYWFEHNALRIDDLGSGSTVKGISINELRGIPFPHLSLPEQTAIATVLSDMDAEITALEQRRNKAKEIKQAMMQELLTGKTRLI